VQQGNLWKRSSTESRNKEKLTGKNTDEYGYPLPDTREEIEKRKIRKIKRRNQK
jgi:hypothetical protein